MLPAFMTLFLAVILAPPAAAQEEPCRQVKDCPKNECCPLEALTDFRRQDRKSVV